MLNRQPVDLVLFKIPDPDGPIRTAAGQILPIWAEVQTPYCTLMLGKGGFDLMVDMAIYD